MNLLFHYRKMMFFVFNKMIPRKTTEVKIQTPTKIRGKLQLKDIFKSPAKYKKIINILIQKEYISSVDHFWIDHFKGNKALIIAIIKYLQVQGYFYPHFKLTHQSIIDISWNTFGIEIGIDHIKHTSWQKCDVSYIPPSNTI